MEALAVKTSKPENPSAAAILLHGDEQEKNGKEINKKTGDDYEDNVFVEEYNIQDVLEIVTLPRLPQCTQPNDVLIQVAYSDVNPVDWQRLLQHHIKINDPKTKGAAANVRNADSTPFITGHGGTGIVIEVGDMAPQHLLGKAVCFLGDPTRPGSWATHVVADARSVAVLPDGSGGSLAAKKQKQKQYCFLREAATIPVAGLTAYESLAKVGLLAAAANRDVVLNKTKNSSSAEAAADADKSSSKVEEEEAAASSFLVKKEVGTANGGSNNSAESSNNNDNKNKHKSSLLIVGGSGGVGSWCITLARAWHPHLDIYATASTEHEAWCYRLGASKVCRHDPDDISQTCLQGGRDARQGSVDAIICLTEPTPTLFSALANVVKPYGTICLVVSGDSIQRLDLSFCFFKCVNIATQTVFSSIRTNFQIIQPRDEIAVILQLLAAQTIQVPLSPMLLQQQPESGGNGSNNNNNNISDKFKHVLLEDGILALLAQKPARKYCGNLVLCIGADSKM